MPPKPPATSAVLQENRELRARLEEAEEMLRAIGRGEADALVIQEGAGPRVYTIEGQEAETNRFRSAMLAQVSDAVIAVNEDERIVYLNAAAEQLYGFPASSALGRLKTELRTLRWSNPGDEAAAEAAFRARGRWQGECIHVLNDGRTLNIELSHVALRDSEGHEGGRLTVLRDVTERKKSHEKVLISEIRYRRLFESARDGILILDPGTGKIVEANPFMTRILGHSHDKLMGRELFEIGLVRDEADNRELFRELQRVREVRFDSVILETWTGQHKNVELVANLYDESDRPVVQCNIRDITERRRGEERVKLLLAEVNHRARNLLAVVQAFAHQSAKHCDPAAFTARLSDRIDGLAAGQDLLVRNKWLGVEVGELVEAQLSHFKDLIGTRVLIDGPRALMLTMEAAQGIGMALHELGTNAAKYGALSNRDGQVRIGWGITAGARPAFSISWLEAGGPKVAVPTRTGFGQIIIGRMAEAAVEGHSEIAFREGGLAWNLCAPAENALVPAEMPVLMKLYNDTR